MSDHDDEFDPGLDDLWTQARQAVEKTRRQRSLREITHEDALKATLAVVRSRERYTLPEFWERTGGVALIHVPSNTLLGNFSEWRHRHEKGCKKLVREHEPIEITRTEHVADDWYLGEPVREHIAPQSWTSERDARLDIQLPELGVGSPGVEVRAFLAWGGVMQVRLKEPTRFASPEGTLILDLSAGTNILEVMGLDSKLTLRQEIMK